MPGDPLYESERRTRQQRIDPKLKAAGWTIVPFNESADAATYARHAVVEYPTANGPADYALFVAGQLLGVVEAKKVTLGPQGVLTQAERYAKGLTANEFNFRGLRVPFLFSTNGEIIHFHDVRHRLNLSRTVSKFFKPAALAELLARDDESALTALRNAPNVVPGFRPYQVEANTAVEAAIAAR